MTFTKYFVKKEFTNIRMSSDEKAVRINKRQMGISVSNTNDKGIMLPILYFKV